MSKRIEDIEGIGPSCGNKLRAAGVSNTARLLAAGATRKGRAELVARTGLSDGLIMRCVNMADLFRIRGVASQYAELLEASGVDTVKELRNRRADNLTAKMREVNAAKRLCRLVPSEKTVAGWIEQAKSLPPAVTY
jgi:predicted flap endonuclease-1-like 5' DNA nuclease